MTTKRIAALIVTSPLWIVVIGVLGLVFTLAQLVIYGFTGKWDEDFNTKKIFKSAFK